jgi:hypothetical protein
LAQPDFSLALKTSRRAILGRKQAQTKGEEVMERLFSFWSLVFVFMLTTTGCAKHEFSAVVAASVPDASTVPISSRSDGSGASAQISQGNEEDPRIKFVGPPCVRGTNCVIEFQLDKARDKEVSFAWATNDVLYQTPTPAGQPIYGQPNVHYVPTSGQIMFAPGEVLKTATVQNINPYNIPINIGVVMHNCQFDHQPGDCSIYFN